MPRISEDEVLDLAQELSHQLAPIRDGGNGVTPEDVIRACARAHAAGETHRLISSKRTAGRVLEAYWRI